MHISYNMFCSGAVLLLLYIPVYGKLTRLDRLMIAGEGNGIFILHVSMLFINVSG